MIKTPSPEPLINLTETELKFVILFAEMTLETAEERVAEKKDQLSQLKSRTEAGSEDQRLITELEAYLVRKDCRLDQMAAGINQMKAILAKHP